MIRPIQITLNAAHPELPLVEASTFVGSPSTAFVRGVPATVGSWSITAVRLVFAYPDNSVVTANCVNAASGVWVGTIAPTATSGRTANGYQVLADGIDENGNAVTGYVLGMGDLAVYTRDLTIDGAAGVKWYLHYFDTAPATPRKGDVAKVNGLICLYDGTAWVSFGDGPGFSTDAPAMDGTASAGVAETAARSDHRHPTDTTRASTADATLTEKYGDEWQISANKGPNGGALEVVYGIYISPTTWTLVEDGSSSRWHATGNPPADATSLSFNMDGTPVAATRFIGYQLGSQTDKPLASEAEAEALRQGKQDALTFDNAPTTGSNNPVKSGGIWSAIWGALSALPTGFTSLFDWCVAQLAGKVPVSCTINGKPLTSDVALSGSDIPTAVVHGSPTLADSISTLNDTKSDKPATFTTGNLAALDANGNPTDAGWTAGDLARYSLVAKTINNGAVTLDDRAINAVAVSSSLASLTVNFPTATSGKARDFGLRLTVASGITTAPELALPQGVVCENADGEAPEIGADGAATILYFTETASGVFLVKGEVVTAIS